MLLKENKILRHYFLSILLLVALIFTAWFLKYNFQNVELQEVHVNNRLSIINELDNSLLDAADAETGVRGFLISGEERFLEPFTKARTSIWAHLSNAEQRLTLYGDDLTDLNALRKILEKHFANLINLVEERRNNTLTQEKLLEEISNSKNIMDSARAQTDVIRKNELLALQQSSKTAAQNKSNFYISLIASTFVLSIAIIIVLFQVARNYKKQEQETRLKSLEAKQKEFTANMAYMVSGNQSVESAGKSVLAFLSKTFNVPACRLFLKETEGIRHFTSHGVDNILAESEDLNNPNTELSLIHAALERQEIWEIKNIPTNYWNITSSLGNSVPSCLYFLPIIFQKHTIGIIELASFEPFKSEQQEILNLVPEVLGIGLNAALSREKLQTLLEKTQLQSEELQTQQEELRTNNEELEQQARALESQQESLNIKNRELEYAKKQLEINAEELRNSNQYKSEFLAKMSHELRTPLNGLLILSTLLIENKEKNLSKRQLEFAKSINTAGNDLLLLINDILDLSKIEARKLTLRPEQFDLKSLFKSKKANFEQQAINKGLDFVTDLPDDIKDLNLTTDRQRLDQILRNFLSNAIKFTDKGSVTLKARLDDKNQNVIFSVSDTGIGIAKEKQDLVFNAFEQADSSTSRRYGGTGLGLTISQELASLLGGEINLKSEQGQGSEFSLSIPIVFKVTDPIKQNIEKKRPLQISNLIESEQKTVKESANASEPYAAAAKAILQNSDKSKKSILIVEDDDRFRSTIVDIVKSYDFEPIETGDGEVALALLKEHAPDAILLDIRLPGISGLGILEMIKQLPHLRHIPVHMVSAFDYQHSALRMGALGYLTKPVTVEKIQSALDRITHLLSKNLRRVLLIEDDRTQSLAITELISDKDIEVIAVNRGKEAVHKLQTEIFDCIILDLKLPDVSGFEILDQLNALEVSVPPIIIYTGKDLSNDEEQHLRKYSESIVIKGARSPERLLDEVNLFLHRVETMLPKEQQEILTQLRSQEKSFEGKSVLIVDDDIRNIFALTSALENKGLNILTARDGVEALEVLKSKNKVDLILMDIMMPRMDGYETIRQIRNSEISSLKDLPIIALTAKAMRGDHEKCIEAGASDYLPKPVNLDNLMTVLKVWLSQKGFNH